MAATVIIRTAKQAENLLKAVGASYTIQLPTGEKFTNMKEKSEPKPGERLNTRGEPYKRPGLANGAEWGMRSKHVRDIISKLQPGEVAEVPMTAQFKSVDTLRSCVSAIAFTEWGRESHKTAVPEEKNRVEILRIK